MTATTIAERLRRVEGRIARAAERAGRDPSEVILVAVSKTVEPARIREAVEAGVKILGENRVQEAREKIGELGRIAHWHMIGHLQKNKAKYVAKDFDMLHSLDGISLLDELCKRLSKEGREGFPVLIEVKLSPEETKHGCAPEEVFALAREAVSRPHVHLCGLMTIAPYSENPEDARPFFRRLRELRDELQQGLGVHLPHLSMGMSGDFEVAIEEGATLVRIGTAIFGERVYGCKLD